MGCPSALLAVALAAAPAASQGPKQVVDLPALLEQAREQPSVRVARASAEQAHAKAREVAWMWGPLLEVTAVGGPSQRITCFPSAEECISTEPDQTGLGFSGIFGRVDANLTMPLYTFGKLTDGKRAADAGAAAGDALAEVASHGAALDAARAWFAVKLGRELQAMLDEGQKYVDDELAREEELLATGSGDVTEADRRRVLTLRAEIAARRSEAKKVEELGLAGVHYVLGTGDADVDPAPLRALAFELPPVGKVREAALARPEQRAAAAGADAAARLVDVEWDKWWPDLVLVGAGTLAGSSSVDHPHNAFLNDPYNKISALLGVVVRWAPEPFLRSPKIDQARAERAKAQATMEMARVGLPAEAEKTWAEARDARDQIKAGREGQRQARAWLAAVLQSEAAGLVEAKDLADALLQYFVMRARVIQATFDWNVKVMSLQQATGQAPGGLGWAEEE
ncbi:MAG TPA: TolC family protein [Myxococcales bacterium]|jgi:outer membrane protein TolC